jgi:hypothetical protein
MRPNTLTHHHLPLWLTLCCASLLAACGDDDSGGGGQGPSSSPSRLPGIFQIDTFTVSSTSCDAPGEPQAIDSRMLALHLHDRPADGLGGPSGVFMQAVICQSLAACREFKDAQKQGYLLMGDVLSRGDDAAGWSGTKGFALGAGACIGSYNAFFLERLSAADDQPIRVRYERRNWQLSFEASDGKACADQDLIPIIQRSPCSRLEVIEATLSE